jgi:hypothetical protein
MEKYKPPVKLLSRGRVYCRDPEEWSGFALGLGLDRCAMINFDIANIRTLFENDLGVLQQSEISQRQRRTIEP